ncbi:MAG: protein kinase domain-containing protein [Solirubrobacteraceae bacterium]
MNRPSTPLAGTATAVIRPVCNRRLVAEVALIASSAACGPPWNACTSEISTGSATITTATDAMASSPGGMPLTSDRETRCGRLAAGPRSMNAVEVAIGALYRYTTPRSGQSFLRGRGGDGDARIVLVATLGLQLCSAIGYLHRQGCLHLDLKRSNIICHSGQAKLLDLGISRRPGPSKAGIGTPRHMAPEGELVGVLDPLV